jgi:hypothetical protein
MNKNKLEIALNFCDKIAIWLSINFLTLDALLFILRMENYQNYMIWCSVPAFICVLYFITASILERKFLGGE